VRCIRGSSSTSPADNPGDGIGVSFIAANCDAVLWYSGALVRIVAAFSVGEVDGAVRMGVNKVGKDASTLLAIPRPQGGEGGNTDL